MKLKIRETSEQIEYVNISYLPLNQFGLKIKQTTKFTVLFVNILPKKTTTTTIFTEIPLIRNYGIYTLYDNESYPGYYGCMYSQFVAPAYTFPSWDDEISQTPGITFGQIRIKDFTTLNKTAESSENFVLPNKARENIC